MQFTLECHRGFFFFSYWHRAIGSKWAPPRFWLNGSLLEYVKFGALELISIVSPLSELRIMLRLFFGFIICEGGLC